jgi:hypothetical protein
MDYVRIKTMLEVYQTEDAIGTSREWRTEGTLTTDEERLVLLKITIDVISIFSPSDYYTSKIFSSEKGS